MMFSKDDFQIEDFKDFLLFAPIFIFIALVSPFIIAAYKLGFIMDKVGWLDTSS
jgi:hypothetical protein